jgi:hypothetical protein
VSYLELERTVTKSSASFYTFSATVAQGFIYFIFKEGLFDELSPDSIGRAKLVLGCGGYHFGIGLKITSAQIAIAAHGINMRTLHCRRCEYTIGGTTSALYAFRRIQLPYGLPEMSCFRKCTGTG